VVDIASSLRQTASKHVRAARILLWAFYICHRRCNQNSRTPHVHSNTNFVTLSLPIYQQRTLPIGVTKDNETNLAHPRIEISLYRIELLSTCAAMAFSLPRLSTPRRLLAKGGEPRKTSKEEQVNSKIDLTYFISENSSYEANISKYIQIDLCMSLRDIAGFPTANSRQSHMEGG